MYIIDLIWNYLSREELSIMLNRYYKHLIYHKIQYLNLSHESRSRFKHSQDENYKPVGA